MDASRSPENGCICGRMQPSDSGLHSFHDESIRSQPRATMNHMAVQLDSDIVVFGGTALHQSTRQVRRPEWRASVCMCVISTYNVDMKCWRNHLISPGQHVPVYRSFAAAVGVDGCVYMHGGYVQSTAITPRSEVTSALLGLRRDDQGCFSWRQISFSSCELQPSPRMFHTSWEYENKMWIFGGSGPPLPGYLHEHGTYRDNMNNQLMCFDPVKHAWRDMESKGAVPTPHCTHASAIYGDDVWVSNGTTDDKVDELYHLSMITMEWTRIIFPPSIMSLGTHINHTLNMISPTKLLLWGGGHSEQQVILLDLPSKTLIQQATFPKLPSSTNDIVLQEKTRRRSKRKREPEDSFYLRLGHTATTVSNKKTTADSIILIGGVLKTNRNAVYAGVQCVTTGRVRSLQSLAKRAVYLHRAKLQPYFQNVQSIPKLFRECLEDGADRSDIRAYACNESLCFSCKKFTSRGPTFSKGLGF